MPSALGDGSVYTPGFFVDAQTSIGSAVTADGAFVRLLVVPDAGAVRELRRMRAESAPQLFGFTSGSGWVAWAESAEDASGERTTSMWVIGTGLTGAPRRIVADAGDVRQTDSAYDLAIVDGRLHWTAVVPGDEMSTELRSVVLDGGDPRTRTVPRLWSPVAWPWLIDSTDAVGGGRIVLMDRIDRATKEFTVGPADFPSCGATWCRSILIDDGASAGVDLVRVDGTERRRIAGPDVGFPVTDVAVLDRFELLTGLDPASRAAQGRPLQVYDIARAATVTIASDAINVRYAGGFLWWSSGFEDRVSWTVIELRALS
ncbi:hypothetical protein O7635_01330 [Asanoa sp. WMMD1127]|uniref:hypothetical protein n=1 Tax=Asanoa sp. WMMD1127 TaxID=3016107 RepID=UPI002415A26D|nr:hypothetical protein [Asanoa sp. WMMD1127]MDG4820493.1 hypothetical protein [Asanoa sp. WMMD1127]